MKIGIIRNNVIATVSVRLDSKFHLSDGIYSKSRILGSPYLIKKVGDVTKNIFYGNRAKRIYVNDVKKGVPFISSSDMLKSDFSGIKHISKKYSQTLSSLLLEKDWILISRSGTIGNTVYTNELFQNKAGSEHIIRVVPNNEIYSGYLYSYLSSKFGYTLLTQGTFGAVIQHIEPEHIKNLPVPIFPESKQQEIHNLIVESANLRVEANRLLEEAQNKITSQLGFEKNKISKRVSITDILMAHQMRFESQYYKSIGSYYRSEILNLNHIFLKDISENIFRPGIFKRNYIIVYHTLFIYTVISVVY